MTSQAGYQIIATHIFSISEEVQAASHETWSLNRI